MRFRSRWVLGLCGLALSAPAASTASAQGYPYAPGPAAMAASPGGGAVIPLQQSSEPVPAGVAMTPGVAGMPPAWNGPQTGPGYAPGAAQAPGFASTAAAPAGAANHHHHGPLGRRHCVECQRAHVKAVDGVDVPPPPGYPGAPAMAAGGIVASGPVVVREYVLPPGTTIPGPPVGGGRAEAGFAVVNGEMPAAEPTPVGMARGGQNAPVDPRMAAAMSRPGAGSYDPAVMPTSVPPPPTPMSGPGHNRPHIISHVLGLPIIGKQHQKHEEKKRETHAMEAYGDAKGPVTNLPASVVYGKR